MGVLLYFYAKSKPPIYTANASLFPQTDKGASSGGSLLSSLTGGGSDLNGNLSSEASISLDDLAHSRNILESVVEEKIPAFDNKSIAYLLIENANKHTPFYATKYGIPTEPFELKALGAALLKQNLTAKSNKNGLFQVSFSSTDKGLVSPVTYIFIKKVSDFYIDLTTKKAQSDLNFTRRKIDSLRSVMNAYDRKAINLNNTTRFVPQERIEYTIPKENLINDKTRIVGIYNGASNNKESALWKLQRITPILDFLDKPDPPFYPQVTSAPMYAAIGFFLGCILATIFFVMDILFKYSKSQVTKAIFSNEDADIVEEQITVTDTENETVIVEEHPTI